MTEGETLTRAALASERESIYIFRCGEFVKIGKAKNVQDRLSQIQISNPQEVTIVAAFQSHNPFQDEARIHALVSRHKVRGEWFSISDSFSSDLSKAVSVTFGIQKDFDESLR